MLATIDQAGRVVIPKYLREQMGFVPGVVTITVSGAGIHIEPPTTQLIEHDSLMFLPSTGNPTTTDDVRELRLADQR